MAAMPSPAIGVTLKRRGIAWLSQQEAKVPGQVHPGHEPPVAPSQVNPGGLAALPGSHHVDMDLRSPTRASTRCPYAHSPPPVGAPWRGGRKPSGGVAGGEVTSPNLSSPLCKQRVTAPPCTGGLCRADLCWRQVGHTVRARGCMRGTRGREQAPRRRERMEVWRHKGGIQGLLD